MSKIKVYIAGKGVNRFGRDFDPEESGFELLCEREKVALFDIFDTGKKRFGVGSIQFGENGYAISEEIGINEEDEKNYESNLVCPFCGYEDQDAFELSDSGETRCGRCNAELSYEREISVAYSTKLLSSPTVTYI